MHHLLLLMLRLLNSRRHHVRVRIVDVAVLDLVVHLHLGSSEHGRIDEAARVIRSV